MTDSMKLAEAVAAQLARHLSDVIICPGSRNAPLSLALLAREDIRVHTRLDERSAACPGHGARAAPPRWRCDDVWHRRG